MARTTTVSLTDDIDGSEAAETVTFALDGQPYEIDLSAEHAQALRGCVHEFIAAARRTGGLNDRSKSGRRSHSRRSHVDASAVRAWANENGVHVSHRGRIPADVAVQYANAQQAPAPQAADKPHRGRRKRS